MQQISCDCNTGVVFTSVVIMNRKNARRFFDSKTTARVKKNIIKRATLIKYGDERNRKYAPKPAILPEKVKLAEAIKKEWTTLDFQKHPTGPYYWKGVFLSPSGQLKIRIYFQRYSRNVSRVDYVDLHWFDENKALLPGDIRSLLNPLKPLSER